MSSAVIAIVKGGLGNQLFIYATARALALRTKRALYLDTTRGYTKDDYGRSYRLDRFPNLKARPMPEEWRIAPTLKHPRHKFIRTLNKFLPRNQRSYFGEQRNSNPQQLTELHPSRDRITLLGYWQNEAYFADHATTIRTELTPPTPPDTKNHALGEKIAAGESIFLHFRRVRYWNLLGRDYYQAAIDAALAKLSSPHFVLFGDDLSWPQQNLDFHGASMESVNHNSGDELADLWLMSRCRHAVVANSSFSWWGTWLGDTTPNRLVFAPQQVGWDVVMSEHWQRLNNTIEPGVPPNA